jgi:MFS family permease
LLPMTVAIMVLMVSVSGKLIERLGYKTNLVLGLVALTASLLWFSLAPVDGTFAVNVLGPSLLGAIGMSLAYIPGTMAAISGAKPEEAGLASGLANTTYQVGSAIGLAVVVAIAISTTNDLSAGQSITKEALNAGFQSAFRISAVISGLGVVATMLGIKQL